MKQTFDEWIEELRALFVVEQLISADMEMTGLVTAEGLRTAWQLGMLAQAAFVILRHQFNVYAGIQKGYEPGMKYRKDTMIVKIDAGVVNVVLPGGLGMTRGGRGLLMGGSIRPLNGCCTKAR